jgi:type I restriction enzyme S subunit
MWILSWLLSPAGRQHVENVASSTTGLYTLSVSKVGNLPIPLPPSPEQTELVRGVERRLAAAHSLAVTLSLQLDRARTTRQSLLHEAFAGRLASQGTDDEPASVLLDRIRAVRETEAKTPKAKRMPKTKSKTARRPLLDVLREHSEPMTPEQLFHEAGFQPAQADLFYRELASLRKSLREEKPPASGAKTWPYHAQVLLELKRG